MSRTVTVTAHENRSSLLERGTSSAITKAAAHPHDLVEDAIAQGGHRGVTVALERFFAQGKQERLRDLLVDAFAGTATIRNFGSDAHPNSGVQIQVPSRVKGMDVPVKSLCIRILSAHGATKASYGSGIITLAVDTDVLRTSNSFLDSAVQHMLIRIGMQLHHETVHISSGPVLPKNLEGMKPYLNPSCGDARGTSFYNEAKINYYTDPGELRAHAKQHAFLFRTFYGASQPFDKEKMLALLPIDQKIERFFVGLTESGESKIWGMDVDPYAHRLRAAHEQFTDTFNYFLELLNSRA